MRIRIARLASAIPCVNCDELFTRKNGERQYCSLLCRFVSSIDTWSSATGCWLWNHKSNLTGYGTLKIDKKKVIASRFSYEFFKKPISDGMFICHTCDNRKCVNPDHLWEGSNKENQIDSVKKNRHAFTKRTIIRDESGKFLKENHGTNYFA